MLNGKSKIKINNQLWLKQWIKVAIGQPTVLDRINEFG